MADHYIIADPEPGWSPGPQGALQQAAAGVEEPLAAKGMDGVAVEAWFSPDASEGVEINVARWGGTVTVVDISTMEQILEQGCGSAGASGAASPDPQIPHLTEVICNPGSSVDSVSGAIIWYEANVVGFVEGLGDFSQASLEAVASEEYAEIPPGGIGGSGFPYLLVGAVVVVAAGAATGIVLYGRRRSGTGAAVTMPAPAGRGWSGPGYAPPSSPAAAYGPGPPAAAYGPGPPPAAYRAGPPAGAYGAGPPPAAYGAGPPPAAYRARASVPDYPGGSAQREAQPSLRWGAESEPQPSAQPTITLQAPVQHALAAHAPARQSAPPQPAAGSGFAPGWYQDGGPYELRYFDGRSWIAHKRWNGESWVDVA